MAKSLMPRIRNPFFFLFSALLAFSAIHSSIDGKVAAAQVLSENMDGGSNRQIDGHSSHIGYERDDASQNGDKSSGSNVRTEIYGDEDSIDPSDIPPVYFSLLPTSGFTESNTQGQVADPSSILNLTLYFTPMFPVMSQSNPLLRNVFKARHSFDEGPIDAEWATFEGGPSGLAKTKCTIEGHDDFEVSNFMRVGERRSDIKGADYILCLTSL